MNRREFVTCAICAGLATTAAKVGALAQDGDPITVGGTQYPNRKAFVETGRRCGTPLPSLYDIRRTERVRSALRTNRIDFNTKTVVPVYVHIIQDGALGNLSDQQITEQFALLNRVYDPALLQFRVDSVGRHHNPRWYQGGISTPEEAEMKATLGRNMTGALNFYTAGLKDGLLGWATFPWYLWAYPVMDGVVVNQGSLPGAGMPPFDLGMTAVHEIGHWAGLFHTFQGGCAAPGDEVQDTAFEESSAAGCPLRQLSSCPGETRFNPVENYMDYSDDACMKEFTPIQVQRVKDMVGYYRYQLQPPVMRSQRLAKLRRELE
jgi:Pregnancy-associated plasma protein-A